MQVAADQPAEALRAQDYDALALVGSPQWEGPRAPYVGAILAEAHGAGKVIGAICGATLAFARAGLLNDLRHTSNSLDYLQQNAGNYRGGGFYANTAGAVSDGGVITAPGSAPVTFASAMLRALLPDRQPAIAAFTALCAREHAA
ncbi:MAG: DJ-1/PfpI family protein [Alphaproteobacteria bacterium]